jgi:Holliday junction resolvase
MKNLYRQGYQAELKLVHLLRQRPEFHTVIRSAGSRSPFDVIAIGRSRILLCQVKTGKGRFPRERRELRSLPLPRCTVVEVWVYRRGAWTALRVK